MIPTVNNMKRILAVFLFFFIVFNVHSQKVIFMDYENGVYKIACKVNGIPMKFILDTGASDVSISSTEANFLLKQGLLTKDDIKGSVEYQIANGEIKEGTKIVIREISIHGLLLKNIEASIVHSQNAPLLLGQSAISKLGMIQLEGSKLVIFPKFERNKYKFLDIDLSKNITDFGYSSINLNDELTSITFSDLNINNNHFLKKYNFDKNVVVFNNKGNITLIGLQKKTLLSDNFLESAPKDEFKSIIKDIEDIYGISDTKTERVCEWKNADFEMLVTLASDNSINLMFNNLNVKNVNAENWFFENKYILNKKHTDYQRAIGNIKNEYEKYVKELFSVLNENSKLVQKFIEFNQNDINISTKINFPTLPKHYKKNENVPIEYKIIEELSFADIGNMITSDLKESFELLNIETINWTYEFNYAGYETKTMSNKMNVKDLLNLKFPYSENEFKQILK
tara:strand:+ start:752 stop:2113 length:1362 start_codon:yes stop_codon:yes gene_type:complete